MTEPRASDTVAAKIRDARKARGWTMADLADRCPGMSLYVIENIESGRRGLDRVRKRDITVDELIIIAEALDVRVSSLLPERVLHAEAHGWNEAANRERQEREARRLKRLAMIKEWSEKLDMEHGRLHKMERDMTELRIAIDASSSRVEQYRNIIEDLRTERD